MNSHYAVMWQIKKGSVPMLNSSLWLHNDVCLGWNTMLLITKTQITSIKIYFRHVYQEFVTTILVSRMQYLAYIYSNTHTRCPLPLTGRLSRHLHFVTSHFPLPDVGTLCGSRTTVCTRRLNIKHLLSRRHITINVFLTRRTVTALYHG